MGGTADAGDPSAALGKILIGFFGVTYYAAALGRTCKDGADC
jgi:hypothetical protein